AVNLPCLRNLPTGCDQLRLRPLDLLVIDPRAKMVVFSYHHVPHIEPHLEILFGDNDRGFRSEGVPHAELENALTLAVERSAMTKSAVNKRSYMGTSMTPACWISPRVRTCTRPFGLPA